MARLNGAPYPTSRRGLYQQDESNKVKVLAGSGDGKENR